MLASLLLLVFFLALAGWTLWRLPALHPAQLWAVPWACAVLLYSLHLLPYRWVSGTTVLLAIGSALVFSAGALVAERALGPRLPPRVAGDGEVERVRVAAARAVGYAAVATSGATLVLLAGFIVQAAGKFGLRATFITSADVRLAVGAGELALTVKYVYFALAATALASVAAALSLTRRGRWAWRALAASAVFSVYFSTGRSTIVLAALAGLAAYVLARRTQVRPVRLVVAASVVGAFTVAVFLVGGQLVGKNYANNPYIRSVPSIFNDHDALSPLALPYEYGSATIPALDVQMSVAATWGHTHGCAMFVEVCRVLDRFGVDVYEFERVRQFTAQPLPWNTYTALDSPILDFGPYSTIPVFAIFGFFFGLLWAFVRRGSTIAVCAYAVLSAAVLTAYGQFNFTAPHLVGGALIACLAVLAARLSLRNEARSTGS